MIITLIFRQPHKLSRSLRERVGVRELALMCYQGGIRTFLEILKL
jgi:hypothetical protein